MDLLGFGYEGLFDFVQSEDSVSSAKRAFMRSMAQKDPDRGGTGFRDYVTNYREFRSQFLDGFCGECRNA